MLVQPGETLKCYSCSGGKECGKLFSSELKNIEIVESLEKNTISSCSVRMINIFDKLEFFCHSDKCYSGRIDNSRYNIFVQMSKFIL